MFIKNKYSSICAAIICMCFIAACSNMDYEPGFETKMVVNAHLNSFQNAEVYLTESLNVGIENQKLKEVYFAEVWLYEDDTIIAPFEYKGMACYHADYIPIADKKYTIKAKSEYLPEISGSVIIPEKPELTNFSITSYYRYLDTIIPPYNGIGSPKRVIDTFLVNAINFKFKDFEEIGNFYRLSSRKEKMVTVNSKTISFKELNYIELDTIYPELKREWFSYLSYEYYFWSDTKNNGVEFDISFKIENSITEGFPLKYYICFEHLSPQTIEYYKAISEYYRGMNNLNNDSAMTVDILNNDFGLNYVPFVIDNPISGGYGFITAGAGMLDSLVFLKRPVF